MVRLNLQLFAKKSVTAIANEVIQGKWGNGATRKNNITKAGYNYDEVQSTVNSILGGGTTKTTSNKTTSNKTATNKTTSTSNTKSTKTSNPTFDGVDQKYVDEAYKEYKPSEKENEYLAERDKYGQSMVDKINAGPQFSESVTQAFDWLEGQQDYFKNGKTSWDEKIFSQIDAIENREKFEYDVDNDQLFQQALASAMNSGKTAMQDTIGQASALTGGYGSTYATSAGNQAYNAFIEDAYNNLPEYYNMALQAYQMEGEEMYNLLGVYTQMGEQEWNRNVDAYNIMADYANSERDFQYRMYQDDITNTYNAMNMYGSFYEQENTKNMLLWQQNIDNAWKTIGQQSSDYWSRKNFDEGVRQFDLNYAQTASQNAASQSLREKEYRLSTGDTNGDGVLSKEERADMNTNYMYDENGKIIQVDPDSKYENYINPDDVEVDENGNITSIKGHTLAGSTEATKPTISGFRTTEGDNFTVTIGENSYKVENDGEVTDKETKDALAKAPSYGNIRIYKGKGYIESGGKYYEMGGLDGLFNRSGYNDLMLALQK